MTADLHPDTGLPRPGTCCGVCPPIAGGGWDCTCEGMPGCPAAARAEAERRYNSAALHSDLTYPAHALESHRRGAFVAGAKWAAGPTETTTEWGVRGMDVTLRAGSEQDARELLAKSADYVLVRREVGPWTEADQ